MLKNPPCKVFCDKLVRQFPSPESHQGALSYMCTRACTCTHGDQVGAALGDQTCAVLERPDMCCLGQDQTCAVLGKGDVLTWKSQWKTRHMPGEDYHIGPTALILSMLMSCVSQRLPYGLTAPQGMATPSRDQHAQNGRDAWQGLPYRAYSDHFEHVDFSCVATPAIWP